MEALRLGDHSGFSLGSSHAYGVAGSDSRKTLFANSRTAFASLPGPLSRVQIPLEAGMSIALFDQLELLIMLVILCRARGLRRTLLYRLSPLRFAGLGGAGALPAALSPIADIVSDLMKSVFQNPKKTTPAPGSSPTHR